MEPVAQAKTVLVVDDDPEFRATLCRALEVAGFAAVEAGDGREALEKLRAGLKPRLILLDLIMPVMDGWEFRGMLLGDPTLAEIPVLVMTAGKSGGERIEAEGVFPKLAGLDKLLRAVRLLCG